MKKIYYLGLCALLAGSFASCKDDIINDGGGSIADMDGETGYISFRIKSANSGGMTRAWLDDVDKDYEKGDPSEITSGSFAGEDDIVNNVQANRVFFFNSDGTYHSTSLLTLESGGDRVGDDHNDGYDAKEIVYSTTVKKTSDRGAENWPSQCLVVLNGRPSRLNGLIIQLTQNTSFNMPEFLNWVNEDLRDTDASGEGLTLGLYKYNDKHYFTMTNSIFLDGSNNLYNATQISADNLKMTREEAAESPVTVYVERIMAKVEVGFTGYNGATSNPGYFSEGEETPYGFLYSFTDTKEGNSTFIPDDEDQQETVELKALITNWTINAVEYKTKLFKEISTTWNETGTTLLNPDEWNDVSHHRSYWAIDPHYKWDATKYPTQYRLAFDGTATPYQESDGWVYGEDTEEVYGADGNDIFDPAYPWALDYKSFNKILSKRKAKYCLENTFDLSAMGNQGYKYMIMGSHLLIQARLLTNVESQGDLSNLDNISDKYYFSDAYYSEESYIKNRASRMAQVLGENVGDYTIKNLKMWPDDKDGKQDNFTVNNIAGGLWVKEGTTFKKVVAKVENANSQIAATDVFRIAPAYVAKGDGKVTIALKGNDDNGYGYGSENVNLYYFPSNTVDESGQPAGEDNTPVQFTRNMLVSMIYQIANTADCFKNGMMYYAVPIQHYIAAGEGKDYEYNYGSADAPLNTGDYGIVRNHWYKFTVNKILKPGIPVHDPDQPIIPNYDETDRYIGLQVIILPWHIVNNGNVTLGENK